MSSSKAEMLERVGVPRLPPQSRADRAAAGSRVALERAPQAAGDGEVVEFKLQAAASVPVADGTQPEVANTTAALVEASASTHPSVIASTPPALIRLPERQKTSALEAATTAGVDTAAPLGDRYAQPLAALAAALQPIERGKGTTRSPRKRARDGVQTLGTTVHLPTDFYPRLDAAAQNLGVTRNFVIEYVLGDWLAHHEGR